MPDWLFEASAWVIPVILAITLHEAAHGWVAEKFGDDTARVMGRVTFNPFKHIDRFGTIIMPGLLLLFKAPFLFGYAKPVPVDFSRLHPHSLGMFMVAIAGVTVNLLLALASGVALDWLESFSTPEESPWLFMNLYHSIMINCVLIVFNLLPILPLDGGRVVVSLLSGSARSWYAGTEKYGMAIIFLALIVPPLLGYSLVSEIIGPPTFWLMENVLVFTGNPSLKD